MSTQTVTPSNTANQQAISTGEGSKPVDQPAHTSENISSELYTLVVGYTKDELEKPEDKRRLKAYPEDAEAVSQESQDKGEFTEVFRQTFRQYFPENLNGVGELIPDDEEVLNLITAQLKVKLVNRARSSVTSKDFTPSATVIDQFDEAGRKSERRLSPFEKTKNEILNNMPKEMQAKLLEMLQAQLTAPAGQ